MNDLNKPAAAGTEPLAWQEAERPPRWYLWEGGFLVIGRAGGEVPSHAHHAIQVHIALEGRVAIRAPGGEWRHGAGTIVRADVEHSFNAGGASGAMLMVDPESAQGAWLQAALPQDITVVPETRLSGCVDALRAFVERPLEAMDVGELVRYFVQALCPGAPLSRKIDARVAAVLESIRDSDDLRLSLEDAARAAHLSSGRFAHLFSDELGLPFRRYMLWRKVTRAMLCMGKERTLAAAAP